MSGGPWEKMGEIWRCCHNCDKKKTKCIHLSPEEASILLAAMAEKKAKAATKKAQTLAPRTQSRAPVNTWAASRIRLPSVGKTLSPLVDISTNEDAEGEDVAEPDLDANSQLLEAATPAPNVDNNVNMDFNTQTAMPDLPVSDVLGDAPPNPAVQQPSNLDIIQTIQAMRQEFTSMLQNLGQQFGPKLGGKVHCNEEEDAGGQTPHGQKYGLHWALGQCHEGLHSFQPTAGPSTQGHPFGQIPPSWIPQLPPPADVGHPQDPSASEVGKLFTMTSLEVLVPVLQGKALHPQLSPLAIPLASVQAHNCQASLPAVPLTKISWW
ncbi:hypothetical protein F4604DRAFT_1677031 [Suillus subluteus]|nr:hypothetical protein F4604DRAFT_1677031 [Suillus subluteus]